MRTVPIFTVLVSVVSAQFFNFFNSQQQQQQQQQAPQFNLEQQVLESQCNEYICPDSLMCVSSPQECPCPFRSSQLRCVLSNKEYVCISKPAGKFDGRYDDLNQNWKVDARDVSVRDCGWVKRAWEGTI